MIPEGKQKPRCKCNSCVNRIIRLMHKIVVITVYQILWNTLSHVCVIKEIMIIM